MEQPDQPTLIKGSMAGRPDDTPGFFNASGSSPGLLGHALTYAAQGWTVFPLSPGAKVPLGGNGHRDATTDPVQIRTMWAGEPEAGIGNRPETGEVVIDVDPRSGGDESFAELVGRLGPLPPTVTTETGGGGRHYRFRFPPDIPLPKQLARGIDLKGHNGYVILPPSRHPNRKAYKWATYGGPEEQNVAVLPELWVEELRKATGIGSAAVAADAAGIDPARVLDGVPQGQRDDALFRYASQMRRRGLDRAEAETLALVAARNCAPPFPDNEARSKVAQAWKYAPHSADAEVLQAASFVAQETEANPSLLGDGIIAPGTLTILGGDDGAGKTALVLNLALCLAAGRDFLGMPVPRPHAVLFLEAEGNESRFRQRIRTAAESLGIDLAELPLYFPRQPYAFQIAGPALPKELEQLGPDLVVFDTIGYFYAGEENSNSDWKHYVSKPLRHFARTQRTAFLLIQHLGKQNDNRKGKQRLRGGSAQSGDSDTTLLLDRGRAETDRILRFEKIKNGPRQEPLALRFDEARAVFTLTGEDAAIVGDPRLGQVQQIVVEKGEIRAKVLQSEILSRIGVSPRTADELIHRAVAGKLISRPRRGVYGPLEGQESVVEPQSEKESIPQFPHVQRRAAEPAEAMDGSSIPQNVPFAQVAEPKRGAL